MAFKRSLKVKTVSFIIICSIPLLVPFLSSSGQKFGDTTAPDAAKFKGVWEGNISIQGSEGTSKLRIRVTDFDIIQYFYSEEKNEWYPSDPDIIRFTCDRNNALAYWHSHGGAWSETQLFSLSFINNRELDIVWARHVNNVKEDKDNESWHALGHGKLYKK